MKESIFRFKQFDVKQNSSVFKVGTDAVLLGLFVDIISTSKTILDIGTGTGIVSLMLAQRCENAKIVAIDIDENAYSLAQENFKNSPFSDRLIALLGDVKTKRFNKKFDLIVTNPPFFDSLSTHHSKNTIARQQIQLNYIQLFTFVSENLTESGNFTMIYPYENKEDILEISLENKLYLNNNIYIQGIENGKIKRIVSTFSYMNKNIKNETFILEKSPRKYSDEYKNLAKDFYLKF